jgi:antirestriction protein
MEDNDPEWAIHDYEWTSDIEPREISEYDNIQELNEFCQELDDLEEWEAEEIAAAIEAYGYTFAEAMDRQQRGCFTFYPGQDLEEVAEQIADECYLYDAPEFLTRYFDYEAFARDLSFDGYTETKYGVICDS